MDQNFPGKLLQFLSGDQRWVSPRVILQKEYATGFRHFFLVASLIVKRSELIGQSGVAHS